MKWKNLLKNAVYAEVLFKNNCKRFAVTCTESVPERGRLLLAAARAGACQARKKILTDFF
jgi:hypothetical protein